MQAVVLIIVISISMIFGGMLGTAKGYRQGQIDYQNGRHAYIVENGSVYSEEKGILKAGDTE